MSAPNEYFVRYACYGFSSGRVDDVEPLTHPPTHPPTGLRSVRVCFIDLNKIVVSMLYYPACLTRRVWVDRVIGSGLLLCISCFDLAAFLSISRVRP